MVNLIISFFGLVAISYDHPLVIVVSLLTSFNLETDYGETAAAATRGYTLFNSLLAALSIYITGENPPESGFNQVARGLIFPHKRAIEAETCE